MTLKPARSRVGQLTPTALSLLVLLGCPETGAVPSGTVATDTRPSATPATVSDDRPATLPAPSVPPAKVELVNGPRFAVQLYATQDEEEARARKGAIDRVGLQASVVTAELGERGRWYRLLIGSYSRRDLAELAGARLESNVQVRKLLPAPAPGEPFFIVQSAPPAELAPRVATGLAALVPGGELAAAIAREHAGQPSGALVAAAGDARIRFVDAAGALGEPLPQPRFPGSRACLNLAAAGRVQGIELLAVDDLVGDDASEALIGYRFGAGRACASLLSLGAGGETSARELGGFLLEASAANSQEVARVSFVDVDADEDAELMVERLRAVTHEGALCEVQREPLVYDIEAAHLRVMDESFFAALGATSARGGAQTFARFALMAEGRADAALLIPAAVSYLSQAGASADADARKRFFAWLDALEGPGATRDRMGALARLAAARPEYRASLAGKLDRALAELLTRPALGDVIAGCDEAPLAGPGRWSAKPAALEQMAQQSLARADLRTVPDNVFIGLASAYPVGSPIATKLDQLVERLAPASARHASVKRAVAGARAAQAR